MNLVFWLLAIIGLVLLWFALTPLFRRIGVFVIKQLNKTKKEIEREDNFS